MIESAVFQSSLTPRDDAGYKSWQTAARRIVMRHDLNDRTAGPMPAFGNMVHQTALAAQGMHYAPQGPAAVNAASPDIAYEGEGENPFGFGDVLDIINPLQHLPVIGTIYRKFTGDTIKPLSNIIGGAIFGGPVGAISSAANVAVKQGTGKDIAENALSMVGFDASPAKAKPAISIESPLSSQSAQASQSLAVATLYETTASGQRNFASKASAYSWNT